MDKPTVDSIQKRYKAYDDFYGQLHSNQTEIDDYYELVFSAGVPEDYPARMPSTARDWVDVGVRYFTLDNPKSKVFQRNDSEAARKQVSLMELFYNFWLRKDIVIIKDIAKKLLLRGEVFAKVNMDDTYFGRDTEERLFTFPLYLTNPDPINVYCSPAHNGFVPHDVIEDYDITVSEAEAMCEANGWDWESDKAPDKTVSWRTYYDAEWRCFLLDDEPVLKPEVQPNILGFCPYVHISAGAGQTNYEGKPEYLYRSILWGKRDMLKMEVRNLSQLDAILSRYAWPRIKVKGEQAMIDKYYKTGVPTDPALVWYELPDGQLEINILQGEQPPASLFSQLAMVQQYASAPEVLSGIRPTGVYSGQHQETLLATAKPIYKDAFKNLEDGLGIAMGMGARIIEKVYNYPVEIKNFASEGKLYQQLKPTDINGHYDCEVQLLAEPPEATDNRKALGKALRQGGSISHMTELRQYQDMSQKEADNEIAQIAAEMAMQEPAVREVVAKNAMMRLGMSQELQALEEAQGQAARPIPPVPQGQGLNMAGTSTRGRISPELGAAPTPQETEVTGRMAQ
jgi:hypothetical protein